LGQEDIVDFRSR